MRCPTISPASPSFDSCSAEEPTVQPLPKMYEGFPRTRITRDGILQARYLTRSADDRQQQRTSLLIFANAHLFSTLVDTMIVDSIIGSPIHSAEGSLATLAKMGTRQEQRSTMEHIIPGHSPRTQLIRKGLAWDAVVSARNPYPASWLRLPRLWLLGERRHRDDLGTTGSDCQVLRGFSPGLARHWDTV